MKVIVARDYSFGLVLSRVDGGTICQSVFFSVQERFYMMLMPRTITGSLLVRWITVINYNHPLPVQTKFVLYFPHSVCTQLVYKLPCIMLLETQIKDRAKFMPSSHITKNKKKEKGYSLQWKINI